MHVSFGMSFGMHASGQNRIVMAHTAMVTVASCVLVVRCNGTCDGTRNGTANEQVPCVAMADVFMAIQYRYGT